MLDVIMTTQPHVLILLENLSDIEKISKTCEILEKHFSVFTLSYDNVSQLGGKLAQNNIGVILSVGDNFNIYTSHISNYGNRYNRLWIHKTFIELEQLGNALLNIIMYCYTDIIINNKFYSDVISVFTTAHNSKEIIYRPYNSLLKQTFKNWEFVIINDSDKDKYEETQQILEEIAKNDPRVKLFSYYRHSGFIGEVKNFASKMCHGYVTVEIDHDDELTHELLEKMDKLYKSDDTIGFVYSDCCELYENKESFTYGEYYGLGYGSYYNSFYEGKWYATANAGPITTLALTDIVGVPNHVRSWRSSVLNKLGYYSDMLYASDDYDLLVKTFLETKMARLPFLGYFQYRNAVIGNNTFKRLGDIRNLQSWLSFRYKEQVNNKIKKIFSEITDTDLLEKGIKSKYITDEEINNLRQHEHIVMWERPYDWQNINFNIVDYDKEKITVVISTYNRSDLLKRAINSVLNQTHQNFQIVVIGDKCPTLELTMQEYKTNKIIWWNLYKNYNDGGATPKNYALRMCLKTDYITYLDDDNYWEPDHLASLYELFKNNENISYAFSNIVMGDYKIKCEKPLLYRVDTSSIMHKRSLLNKYGYWKTHKVAGYAHDYEFVSRWKDEEYASSKKFTLVYNLEGSLNNPHAIFNAYDDQN